MSAQRWAPGYWMHETTGVLRPAVMAYLETVIDPAAPAMTEAQIAAMRAYLRQWIACPTWRGPEIDWLRSSVGALLTRDLIEIWIDRATDLGIDPL